MHLSSFHPISSIKNRSGAYIILTKLFVAAPIPLQLGIATNNIVEIKAVCHAPNPTIKIGT